MLSVFTHLPQSHKILIGFIALVMLASVFCLPHAKTVIEKQTRLEIGRHYPVSIDPGILNATSEPSLAAQLRWKTYQVKSGESAAVLFQRIGLSSRLLYQLTSSSKKINQQLTHLKPGDRLHFGFDADNHLIQLKRSLTSYQTFIISKSGQSYTSRLETKEIHYEYNYAEARITSNFWNAGISAGLTPNQIMELAGIFGWDIDFALDIRKGDHFSLLYQDKIVDGEIVGQGNILAAIFTNQGDTFKAIYDDKSKNYYDENGRAMKKAFLRSPLDFRRVSSNFNPRRLHPVTGKVRPHRGTDYVAPVGTPIWAAGDGIVIKSSYNQFNGNYVFIKHSNTYITKYLHLKRRRVKTGQRVKQGQTIGNLGGTGRVTGPHLHYEFLVHGVHKNPRTVKLPQSKSLAGNRKKTFMANAAYRLQKLERLSKLMYARN